MRRALAIAITSCLLAGCAGTDQSGTDQSGTDQSGAGQSGARRSGAGHSGEGSLRKIVVRDDPFRPFVEFRSPGAMIKRPPNFYRVELFGRKDRRTKQITTFLRVDIAYFTLLRRKYRIARNAAAPRLKVTKISASGNCRGQGRCVHNEIFDIAIASGDLRRAGPNGYTVKLFDKLGHAFRITVSSAKIAAFFAQIDGYRPHKKARAHGATGQGGKATATAKARAKVKARS